MLLNILGEVTEKYSGGQNKTDFSSKTLPGVPEVVAIWRKYVDPNLDSSSWAYKKQVLRVAMELFGTQRNWFEFQERNPSLHGYNYGFVVDTLRFILTGKRNLSVHMWPDLVSHEYSHSQDVSGRHELLDYMKQNAELMRNPPAGMIQRWCSHKGGMDDMICTLNILFGDLTIR